MDGAADVRSALDQWPGGKAAARRKQRLFDDRMLSMAIDRLTPATRMKAA